MRKTLQWAAAALAVALLGAAADPPEFKNMRARDATSAFEKDQRRAEDEYNKRMATARTKYKEALAGAKNAAMKSGDLEDANRMQAEIDQLSEEIKSPARLARADGPLTVRSARYGAGDKWADVTQNVRSHVHGGGLVNFYEGLPDPAFGVHKSLVVEGAYGGKDFVLTLGESRATYYFGEPPREKSGKHRGQTNAVD